MGENKPTQLDDGVMFTFEPEDLQLYDLKTGKLVDKQIEGGLFLIACCDCGLVHSLDVFRDKITGEIGLKFIQDKEMTEERRAQLEAESEGTQVGEG